MADRKTQFFMVGTAIMISIGFMFGIVFSLPDLGGSGNQGGDGQQIQASLPNTTYTESSFGLSPNEQAYLAVQNQKVFVNVVYENSTPDFSFIRNVQSEFGDRVYVNFQEASDSQLASSFQLRNFPAIIVVGDAQTRQGPYVNTADPNRESVKSEICNAMRDPGSYAATCFA
jgi:hypothetical protein